MKFGTVLLGLTVVMAQEEDEFDLGDLESMGSEMMSEEAILAQAREDFKGMDLNHDGKLTPEEVAEYINDAEMAGEISKFFEEADANKDGAVELEEYENFVKKMLADYSNQPAGEGSYEDWDTEDDEEL
jgi:Ca2+-binding EF-hand superfamily protein